MVRSETEDDPGQAVDFVHNIIMPEKEENGRKECETGCRWVRQPVSIGINFLGIANNLL